MTHVAVVGGGYAGMAAAVTLAESGTPVTVFEAGRQLGGRARRVDYRGIALDNGLHILSGAYRETLRMIRLVNAAHASALQRLALDWNMHGEFRFSAWRLPAPVHLLAGLLCARGLSLPERLAAARFVAAMTWRDDVHEPDISVDLLLEKNGQSARLCRVLWRPMCVAALNTPSSLASARVFQNVLRDSLNAARDSSDLLVSRVDLSALFPEPAAAWVSRHGGQIMTGQRVTSIDQTGHGFAIGADGRRHTFSHVVCALPPHQVYAFLTGVTVLSELATLIDNMQYQPIHSVWLQYPESIALPSPMLGFADGIVHWVFDRERLCGQRGLVGAVISARGTHQELTQAELGAQAHKELTRHLGSMPAPLWQRVIAEKRATISCTVGVRRPPQVTPLRDFYLAGDYTASDYPATIEAAVRSGITCANHILSDR